MYCFDCYILVSKESFADLVLNRKILLKDKIFKVQLILKLYSNRHESKKTSTKTMHILNVNYLYWLLKEDLSSTFALRVY